MVVGQASTGLRPSCGSTFSQILCFSHALSGPSSCWVLLELPGAFSRASGNRTWLSQTLGEGVKSKRNRIWNSAAGRSKLKGGQAERLVEEVFMVLRTDCAVFPVCSCFYEGIIQGTFQQLFEALGLMSCNSSSDVGGGSPLSHFSFLLSGPDPRGGKSPIKQPKNVPGRGVPWCYHCCTVTTQACALWQPELSAWGERQTSTIRRQLCSTLTIFVSAVT